MFTARGLLEGRFRALPSCRGASVNFGRRGDGQPSPGAAAIGILTYTKRFVKGNIAGMEIRLINGGRNRRGFIKPCATRYLTDDYSALMYARSWGSSGWAGETYGRQRYQRVRAAGNHPWNGPVGIKSREKGRRSDNKQVVGSCGGRGLTSRCLGLNCRFLLGKGSNMREQYGRDGRIP